MTFQDYVNANGLILGSTATQCIVDRELKREFGIRDRVDYYKWVVLMKYGVTL